MAIVSQRSTVNVERSKADRCTAVRSSARSGPTVSIRRPLRSTGPGSYGGDVDVEISGVPASATGTMRLADNGAGSDFEVHADVQVNVPLIGGKIEEIVAGQVRRLLEAETAFTIRWLESH